MHYGPFGPFAGGGFYGLLIPILLVGLIILALYMIFKKRPNEQERRPNQENPTQSALEILNKRYAMGEINEEEFKRMKKNLLDQ